MKRLVITGLFLLSGYLYSMNCKEFIKSYWPQEVKDNSLKLCGKANQFLFEQRTFLRKLKRDTDKVEAQLAELKRQQAYHQFMNGK